MKKIKFLTSFMLIISTLVGLFSPFSSVSAQEENNTVAVDVQVFLALYGNDPTYQDQISYDIVRYNSATNSEDLIYRYDSTNPSAESLQLPAGNYTFRLYDGGGFNRDGLALVPARAEMTDTALAADGSHTDTLKSLTNQGSIVDWGNGTVVLDVPFEISLADNLFNSSTNRYETELVITVADEQTAQSLMDSSTDSPGEPTEATGGLSLHVVGDDSSFVENAVIAINGEEHTTDAQGIILVEDLPVGQANIEIISLPEAYSTETNVVQAADIVANSMNNATLTVQRVPEAPTTNTVTFTTIDESETPIPNVSITLNEREIYTDTSGQAVFTDVPLGDYSYTINSIPDGYTLDEYTGTLSVVADAENFTTIYLGRPANGSILFTVVNEANEPVSGTEILINETLVATNESGQANIEGLEEGGYSYQVTAVPDGYQTPAEDSVNVVSQSQTEKVITLATTQEYGTALITITDVDGNPIVGAEISLNDEYSFVTNGSGQVTITDLRVGADYEYYITALPEGYEMDGEAERRSLIVEANQQITDTMVITLADQLGNLTFNVVDESNQAIQGVTIAVGLDTLTTDASGLVTFSQIATGDYTYEVRGVENNYEGTLTGQVTVNANETTEQLVTLTSIERLGSVTLSVQDQNNEAVEGAEINLNNQTFYTDASGQVTIEELAAGQTYNYILTSLPENYSGQASGTVTIEADATVTEIIAVERLIELGQLTIAVIDQNNQPVVGAEVQLNQETSENTNSEGQAIFNDLSEGTYEYTISSLADNYENTTSPQSVYIAEGASESRQLQVRRIIESGSVIFNVRDQDEHPVEGVVISINDTTITTSTEGTATASDLEPGDYTYTISELPDRYRGEVSGQVTVNESEIGTVDLHVEREVELSQATIMIVDQNNNPVADVSLAFGGLTGVSNQNGQISFQSLEPGRYNYSITNVPVGYENTSDADAVDIEEGSEFKDTIEIEKLPDTGTARIQTTVNGQAVSGFQITIDGESKVTDNEGYASFENLEVGNYTYSITSIPEGYELGTTEGTIQVVANETTTIEIHATEIVESSSEESSSQESSSQESSSQESSSQESSSQSSSQSQSSSSVNVDESHSLTPQEQASIDEEAAKATRQFIDSATGIEVWVNPVDASNIESLKVEKLTSSAALENADADIYRLTLLNSSNQAVQLTRIAEVKIPTRPVTSQLRIVRINNNNLSNLTFALHNQRVTFRTQQLGDFGVVYNLNQSSSPQDSSQGSVSVSVESGVEERDLPNTGESSSRNIIIMMAISLICVAYLLITRNKKINEQ